MKSNFKTYPETTPFVEALRIVLQAEEKVLEGFNGIFGEEGGDHNLQESGISEAFTALKTKINTWIGFSFELGLSGCLEDKREEGGVC